MENCSKSLRDEIKEMRIEEMREFMTINSGKTIEVPINLLYVLSKFLKATGNLLDEGRQPYPSMEWNCNALGYLLLEKYVNSKDRIPGTLYAVFDTIHQVNTKNGSDIDIEELMKWITTGDYD